MTESEDCTHHFGSYTRYINSGLTCHIIQYVGQTQTELAEDTLCVMVDQKWFGEARKHQLINLKKESQAERVPLSVSVQIGDQLHKLHVSVFEKKCSYYSRLGRVMVSYDVKKNSWHCPCSISKKILHSQGCFKVAPLVPSQRVVQEGEKCGGGPS